MSKEKFIVLFENIPVRRKWVDEEEKWYFSVVDVVAVLTEQKDFQKARKYWNKLKERLLKEGSQVVTKCHRLKLLSQDGKMRLTDVADVEVILRLVQSIPSKKAAHKGGRISKQARQQLEKQTKKKIVGKDNYLLKNKS